MRNNVRKEVRKQASHSGSCSQSNKSQVLPQVQKVYRMEISRRGCGSVARSESPDSRRPSHPARAGQTDLGFSTEAIENT